MSKVVTMGEIMLRLSTPNFERFIQADEFDIHYGGGEANVAVSLANYGHAAEYVTAVPDNEIGECAIAALRKYNVGTAHIARCGERLGIYYLESGSAMRPSKVVYDRAHSSISTATEQEFDFDAIFADADWFHFTGITPAISDSAAVLTESLDLNIVFLPYVSAIRLPITDGLRACMQGIRRSSIIQKNIRSAQLWIVWVEEIPLQPV